MNAFSEVAERARAAREAVQERTPDDVLDNPATRYLPFMTLFGSSVVVLSQLAARHDQRVQAERGALEFAEAILATFYLTRVIAREKVGAPIREPFVEPEPGSDPDDPKGDVKRPTGHGLRQSVGELVTCPRCLGPWAAAAVTFASVLAPRHTRSITRIMALGGANSFAHATHAAVCGKANRP